MVMEGTEGNWRKDGKAERNGTVPKSHSRDSLDPHSHESAPPARSGVVQHRGGRYGN